MLNNIKELIKSNPMFIPSILLFNYRNLNITDSELIILIYLINSDNKFNPKKISNDLNIDLNNIMQIFENLTDKNILKIEINDKKIREEIVNLDNLYDKMAFLVMKKEIKNDNNLFDIFEKEFKRPLSPIEYENIIELQNNFDEKLIISALKEAVSKKVLNIKYIDKIVRNWHLTGIQKGRKEVKSDKELFDYDWLNERDN